VRTKTEQLASGLGEGHKSSTIPANQGACSRQSQKDTVVLITLDDALPENLFRAYAVAVEHRGEDCRVSGAKPFLIHLFLAVPVVDPA